MNCQLCRKKQAEVKVTWGSYQTGKVQILALCLECSKEHWKGHKYCSLRKLVTVGLAYYSIEEIK